VKSVESTESAALSYVWAGTQSSETHMDNLKSFQRNGGLQNCTSPLSQTILDAIELVREMGFRYLWVDRLRIVQDASRPKNNNTRGWM
jgi:hypothetical protein